MKISSRHRNAAVRSLRGLLSLLVILWLSACGEEGSGGLADNGGMSGTGISQGSISAFGSIFVNGIQWDLSSSTIEVDGVAAAESDLRLGMVVRVEGTFDAGGMTGTADRVAFDDSIEGPISNDPIETVPGLERQFSILGQSIIMSAETTAFEDGATFAGLMEDDVVEISGFVDESGAIEATRIQLKGAFPVEDEVEVRGLVSGLMTNMDGSGLFNLGSLLVRYAPTTTFSDVTRTTLMDGDLVEVEGILRAVGDEIDAEEIELESSGLGGGSAERVEVEGIVSSCPPNDFCVGDVSVDSSSAIFEPMGFVPAPGDAVEVEGPLVDGVVVADRVESEDEDENAENVRIEASVMSVDAAARTLVILGLTVAADGETTLEDKSSIDDESFMFGEILPGDFLEIKGIDDGGSEIRARSIEREDATAGADDVSLEGPVTALDPMAPVSLSILGMSLPIDSMTQYFDEMGNSRSEDEFFRVPGDVMIGDIVKAEDQAAADLSSLSEVDEVEIEDD